MKTHLEHKFLSERQKCLPMKRCRMNIFTDFARKRNRKEGLANYNKTRIKTGHQHDRWVELKEALRVQTHAEV